MFGNEVSRCMRRETGYSGHVSMHAQFISKSHLLILAMKWADAWGEKQGTLMHPLYSHTQFSKTHRLMLAMKWADEERNRLLWSCIYTHNSVKLTPWCWQCMKWADEERKQVTQWSCCHPYIHNSVNSPPDWCLAIKWADEEGIRLLWSCIHTYYTELNKTNLLVLEMK